MIRLFKDVLAGGFIWDWVDQSLAKPVLRPGTHTLNNASMQSSGTKTTVVEMKAYGGDFGPPGTPSDANFMANGLVQADRVLSPQVWEIKKAYQPIHVASVSPVTFGARSTAQKFRVTNEYDFLSLQHVSMQYILRVNGAIHKESQPRDTDLAAVRGLLPGGSAVLHVVFGVKHRALQACTTEYIIEIRFGDTRHSKEGNVFDGIPNPTGKEDDDIAWWQSVPSKRSKVDLTMCVQANLPWTAHTTPLQLTDTVFKVNSNAHTQCVSVCTVYDVSAGTSGDELCAMNGTLFLQILILQCPFWHSLSSISRSSALIECELHCSSEQFEYMNSADP